MLPLVHQIQHPVLWAIIMVAIYCFIQAMIETLLPLITDQGRLTAQDYLRIVTRATLLPALMLTTLFYG